MSDVGNPYQAPAASGEPAPSQEGSGVATAKTRQLLGKAGPWLRFLGIMGYIGCGFMVVGGIVVAVVGGAGLFGGVPGLGFMGPALGLVYIAMAVLFFFPARYAALMGKKAKLYRQDGEALTLESVALNLKHLAKFYGISIIVTLGLYVLIIIGMGIFAAVGAFGG